ETAANLIKSAEQYVKEHPTDPEGYLCIGRLKMTLWANSIAPKDRISYAGIRDNLPQFLPWDSVMLRRPGGDEPPPRSMQQVILKVTNAPAGPGDVTLLTGAVESYRKALSLDEKKPLCRLALA